MIVAVPAETAFTVPFETVATAVLLEVHVTDLSVAFDGATVVVIVPELPSVRVSADGLTVIPVGWITVTVPFSTLTVTVAVLPLFEVALIVAVPSATPVITPLETFATLSLLEVHLRVLFVAFDGATVALTVAVSFVLTVADVLSNETLVTSTTGVGLPPSSMPIIFALLVLPRYAPSGITLPGAGVFAVLRTYTAMLPLPETLAEIA